MRDPDRIPMILAAIERRWAEEPDTRLGQLLWNLYRDLDPEAGPSPLFNLEDGKLLELLGAETEAEREYIAGEAKARKRGWAAWEQRQRELHPSPEPERRDRRPWFPTVEDVIATNDAIIETDADLARRSENDEGPRDGGRGITPA